ncbi:MAG: SGNH/GDSL hydrolase family protein [Desulfobacterales bacterium]|nr:SGNH/GDSL hydrolase family protein [Desulfobacterales bacterium]
MKDKKRYIKIISFNLLLILLLLSLYESYMFIMVRSPKLLAMCPRKIQNSIGYLYAWGDRDIIQFTPECAMYDKELGYTLRPGSCVFSGREFSNTYYVNRVGVRDDEASLNNPQIIVAGDSVAMGWGVNQEETYSQLIEKEFGVTVLNAAVSSYGTAREMMMLSRVQTGKLKYLIVQYSGNDYGENKQFYLDNNVLNTMTEEKYNYYTSLYDRSKGYFLGKYLLMKVKKRIREFKTTKEAEASYQLDKDEIGFFLNALINGPVDLKDVQIIAFAVSGRNPADNIDFTRNLKERILNENLPIFIKNMIILDTPTILKQNHFYVLDDHLNRSGHEVIADEIIKAIENTERREKKLKTSM